MATKPKAQAPLAQKPSHRLWMVQDQPNGKPASWTEITGLWENKNGGGVSGATKFWLTIPPGTRLVAMKVKEGAA